MLNQLYGAALTVSEKAEHHTELPMPPVMYAAIIMGALLLLMFVTIAFTSVGKRHEVVPEHTDPHKQHPSNHDVPGSHS
ncbi:hypothetical protein [Arthrobacter roseus]|uniref:hypothetical protein n=1 Tax=Arthrobacter roseus TaxID=136274 RepID=UPI001964E077|nr:hypothetical protein [Arthrobacter roseus]MBM7848767.1 hypothetical protein [Arthrobacter roseus]